MQLRSYRERDTDGQHRRRLDRRGRRQNRVAVDRRVYIGTIRTIEDTIDKEAITRAVEAKRKALEQGSRTPSFIRDFLHIFRNITRNRQIESRIERCTYTRPPKFLKKQRIEFAPCGGRLRKQGPKSESWLVCVDCGRPAKPFVKATY